MLKKGNRVINLRNARSSTRVIPLRFTLSVTYKVKRWDVTLLDQKGILVHFDMTYFSGNVTNNLVQWYFCTKTSPDGEDEWPIGRYCILRYNGQCPSGITFLLSHIVYNCTYCIIEKL